jgi:hypothetical protein
MHADKHVIKMILESCQLLCSAHHICPNTFSPPYKLTHKNHPCAIWVRQSVQNYLWLCRLATELCKEYTFRYGKEHKCEMIIHQLHVSTPTIPDVPFTEPPKAMPDQYKKLPTVLAYRKYYLCEKTHLLTWKKRQPPRWVSANNA